MEGGEMRGIRLIATDLDDTLLRSDKTVSEYTSSIFRRCRAEGIRTVFATARPVRAVEGWLSIDVLADACVYHSGAVVKVDGKPFRQSGIRHDAVDRLLDGVRRIGGFRMAAEIDDVIYADFDAATVWPGIEYVMTDFYDLPRLPADKLIFLAADGCADVEGIRRLLDGNLYLQASRYGMLTVMSGDARKLIAVREVAGHFGLTLDEVAAFGDDHADVGMLRGCGFGVAVANAVEEAKAAAGHACGSNDDDGVAKWLEEFALR